MAINIPDPWSTAAAGGSSQYSTLLPTASAADGGASFQERILNPLRRGRDVVKETAEKAAARVGNRPVGRYATLGTAGITAATTAAGGDLLGAAAELGGGLIGGAGAGMAANALLKAAGAAIPPAGPIGLALKVGLPIAGSLFGGSVAKNIAGGTATAAREAAATPGGPDIAIGSIAVTEAARERQQRERDLAFEQQRINALGTTALGLDRQALQMQRENEVLRQQAMLPIAERINRSNLVNAQAMLASQTSAYQQLGRQAGMFNLARGAQAETGATLRTAISNNPYVGATLSAPSISFG